MGVKAIMSGIAAGLLQPLLAVPRYRFNFLGLGFRGLGVRGLGGYGVRGLGV